MKNFVYRIKTFLGLLVFVFLAFIGIFIPYVYRTLNESLITSIKEYNKTVSSREKK